MKDVIIVYLEGIEYCLISAFRSEIVYPMSTISYNLYPASEVTHHRLIWTAADILPEPIRQLELQTQSLGGFIRLRRK